MTTAPITGPGASAETPAQGTTMADSEATTAFRQRIARIDREAEEHAAARQHAKGKCTARERINDLLLPVVKGVGSERAWVLLGTESLQTFGGSGFLQEYPIEQYVRDSKIDTLYEGTTAIQAQDFFFRKIVRDNGQALMHVAGQVQAFLDALPDAEAPAAPRPGLDEAEKAGGRARAQGVALPLQLDLVVCDERRPERHHPQDEAGFP